MTIFLLFLSLLAAPSAASAGSADPGRAAEKAAVLVADSPAGAEELFTAEFFRHISLDRLNALFHDLYAGQGPVKTVVLSSSGPYSGHYFFDTEQGWRIPAAVSVDPQSGRISGLFFGNPYRLDAKLADVGKELSALPGRKGLLVERLGKAPETLESLSPDEESAVGSAFKLYVLAAAVKAGLPWERVVKLRGVDRSLPTGRLQEWPAGSPLTVHTLATMMISESDNTASDALISEVGRETIERSLPALGHSAPERLRPFLKTSEMFRLKSDTAAALKCMNLSKGDKYAYLRSMSQELPRAERLNQSPFGIDKIEWFASPADLCRLMGWFAERGGEALGILAVNPGLKEASEGFVYAGYKGGSEPGVLSMTWLLRDKGGEWLCLSSSWNDPAHNLDEDRFFGLMGSALRALATRPAAERPGGSVGP